MSFWKTLGSALSNVASNPFRSGLGFLKTIGSASSYIPQAAALAGQYLNPASLASGIATHGFKRYLGSAARAGGGLLSRFVNENKENIGNIIGKDIAEKGITNLTNALKGLNNPSFKPLPQAPYVISGRHPTNPRLIKFDGRYGMINDQLD